MIISKHGMTAITGEHGEVLSDILATLDAVNRAVEEGDLDNEDLYAMFDTAPEVITTFTKNFVKATHK